jgi:hypothetical protein
MQTNSMLRAMLLGAACLLGLSLGTAAQAGDKFIEVPGTASTTKPDIGVIPAGLVDAEKLKMAPMSQLLASREKGEFVKFEKTIVIDTPRSFPFQWSTGKFGYDTAMWQMGEEGSQAVLASGVMRGAPFNAKTPYQVSIDLKPWLPAHPPAQAKTYWVRIVPQRDGQTVGASTAAKITYTKPGPTPVFDSL